MFFPAVIAPRVNTAINFDDPDAGREWGEAAQTCISNLFSALHSTRETARIYHNHAHNCEAQISELNHHINVGNVRLSHVRDTVTRLTDILRRRDSSLHTLQHEYNDLCTRYTDLDHEHQDYREQIDNLLNELEAVRAQNRELEADKAELEEDLADAREARAALQLVVADAEEELDNRDELIDRLQGRVDLSDPAHRIRRRARPSTPALE